jgi:hypothetical protein
MATGTARHFSVIATTARNLCAMPSTRLLKLTLGWSITLCGTGILVNDVSATIAPFLRGVAGAIIKAMA